MPRGIYSQPGKKGLVNEAFFMDMVGQEKDQLARISELNEGDKAAFLKKVNSRKKANKSPDARVSFKPASPHEYQDL